VNPSVETSLELAHLQFNGFFLLQILFSFKMTLGW